MLDMQTGHLTRISDIVSIVSPRLAHLRNEATTKTSGSAELSTHLLYVPPLKDPTCAGETLEKQI